METEASPEYRCMTPEEIAAYVRYCRTTVGMKQLSLANLASVSERTIQRLERGEQMGEDTLRTVAKALFLVPDAFIGPRLIRTVEDELRIHLKWMENFTEVTLKPVADWRAFDELMKANAIIVDDSKLTADDAAVACGIHDYIAGLGSVVETMTYAERIQEARKLFAMLEDLFANCIRAKFTVTETIEQITIGHLILVYGDDEMAENDQMLVPNSYFQYGNPRSMVVAEAYATRLAHYRSVDLLAGPR